MTQSKNDKSNRTTVVGTNIDEVKHKNDHSGMSYNEAKAYIARTTGGHNTGYLSTTNIEAVKNQNRQSQTERTSQTPTQK